MWTNKSEPHSNGKALEQGNKGYEQNRRQLSDVGTGSFFERHHFSNCFNEILLKCSFNFKIAICVVIMLS